MPGIFAKAALLVVALMAPRTSADAQTRRNARAAEAAPPPVPAVPLDKRDSVVAAPGAFNGKPYWLALAQCGGAYFKLNVFYTDVATTRPRQARSQDGDPNTPRSSPMRSRSGRCISTAPSAS